ncbi:MAG: hypothetical protein JXJ18_02110 [Rhodobacteraceae bacterium]|nr:hypothetical protein [Paracoccaceae bacterium]
MSNDDSTYVDLLPKNAPIWLGLGFGLLAPLLLGLFGGVIYSGGAGGGSTSVQVYPLPEE